MAFFNCDLLFNTMLDSSQNVSDLNLSVGRLPQVEIDGALMPVPFEGLKRLLPFHTELIAVQLIRGNKSLARKLLDSGSVDLSYSLRGRTRFRVNIFSQRGTYSIVLRVIPQKIPSLADLGIPQQLSQAADERNGIVLVTGPTGSGKSTTLAAVIDRINGERPVHIITIEDPIEYLHPHKKATVNQREVGGDTQSFALALRAALRQAPKVILVGEMRDRETVSIALEAAETGHLVLSTLHTIDAAKTIERILGVFPRNEEQQIRMRFAQSFRWIVSQRLVPKKGGGRVAVCEILRANERTREYIQVGEKEGRSLVDAMNDGDLDGMQTFDTVLQRLIEEGVIDRHTGLSFATNANNLRLSLGLDDGDDSADAATPEPVPANASSSGLDMDDFMEK